MAVINLDTDRAIERLDNGLTRRQEEALQAQIIVSQLNKELKLHQMADGDGTSENPPYVEYAYSFMRNCINDRPKAAVMVALGNWLRLGKREPASQSAQTINQGVQININIIQAASRDEIMAEIPEEGSADQVGELGTADV